VRRGLTFRTVSMELTERILAIMALFSQKVLDRRPIVFGEWMHEVA